MDSQEEEIPKWANFICPSCGISYGINALVKAIRKRRQKKEEHTNTLIQT
jgi:hypothetical protein